MAGRHERRVAGVSSFGFSGTNAHVVLGAPPAVAEPPAIQRPLHLLTLAARDDRDLRENARRWDAYLQEHPDLAPAVVMRSANAGRARLSLRVAAVVRDLGEARGVLAAIAAGETPQGVDHGEAAADAPAAAFSFPDARGLAACQELMKTLPVFHAALERFGAQLTGEARGRLRSIVESGWRADDGGTSEAAGDRRAAQCAVQCALAEVWQSWGVQPLAIVGAGAGLPAAAWAAGVMSPADALGVAVALGRLADAKDRETAKARRDLGDVLASVRFEAPRVPLISRRTGRILDEGDLRAVEVWEGTLDDPGDSDADSVARAHGASLAVDIAPRALEWATLLDQLSKVYISGVSINWEAVDRPYANTRVPLPTYPFQRLRHWIDEDGTAVKPARHVDFDHVLDVARRQSLEGPLDLAAGTYSAKYAYLDRLATQYIVAAFRTLGAFARAGERETADSLVARYGILPVYSKLLLRWLRRLAAEGFVEQDGDAFRGVGPLPEAAPEMADPALCSDIAVLVSYLQRCGSKLAGVLTGKESALETLFPNGSFEITEFLYETSAVARYFNAIVRAAVSAAAARGPADTLRVMEVGAGTGGTTTALLPALPPDRVSYWFTDVSDLFLGRAQRKFAAHPFVRYGRFDLEHDPIEQGYAARGFDVILGANIVHATSNLKDSLRRVLSLLAPGGLLILLEVTTDQGWFDVSTGLIEGWQKFTDGIRGDSPLLAPARWREVLLDQGFDKVGVFPEPGSPTEALGTHILIARAPANVELSAADLDARRRQDATGVDVATGSAVAGEAARTDGPGELLREISDALPIDRQELLVSYVRTHVAAVLRSDRSSPPGRRHKLMDLGVDSLMAVELRNRLATGLALPRALSATLVFDHPTIEAVAAYLDQELLGSTPRETAVEHMAAVDPIATGLSAADLAKLSDQEVEEMLLKKLGTT